MMKSYDTAFLDTETGQMFVKASDQSGKMIPTGFFFEVPKQQLASPWAFATGKTANKLLPDLQAKLPSDVNLGLFPGDNNAGLQYRATRADRQGRFNCGLLASDIGRSTAVVDDGTGKTEIKQFPDPCLEAAAAEIMAQLEHKDPT